MAKKQLTKQQTTRVETKQQSQLAEQDKAEGLLIKHTGQQVTIEAENGELIVCHLRRNLPNLVVGDKVLWEKQNEVGVVTALIPRKNVLSRQDRWGKTKAVAANIDQMLITIATEPLFSTFLLDCYLAAAELADIKAVIVCNKIDTNFTAEVKQQLEQYRKLDYQIIESSCQSNVGLNDLQNILNDKTSVFVGQSGVGKSSLIQCLLPNEKIQVGKISSKQLLGRHTTTSSYLYHLKTGGDIIDSPGVREFSLGEVTIDELFTGFKEFHQYKGCCQFRNCQHLTDKGCALIEACNNDVIQAPRLASFQKLLKENIK